MAVVGVKALQWLDTGRFPLRTMRELDDMHFGPYSEMILDELRGSSYIPEPLDVKAVARKVKLSEKQVYQSLTCMINRKDQVFTVFKDPDVLKYSMQCVGRKPRKKAGFMREALDDLTADIEDLGLAVEQLGESPLAYRLERLMSGYNKLPGRYVPLIKNERDGSAIFKDMRMPYINRLI